jgi:hypothetical protein
MTAPLARYDAARRALSSRSSWGADMARSKEGKPPPPASPLEAAAIASAEKAFRMLEHKVATPAALAELERLLLERLRVDDLKMTELAVHAAERESDEIADRCLRQVYAEKANAPGGDMSATLRAFGVRAVRRPVVTRGRGAQSALADFMRNILVGMLVQLSCVEYGLRKSRSRASRRDRMPSGASVVAAALWRCGLKLSESRIGEIYDGLEGDLARSFISYFSKS